MRKGGRKREKIKGWENERKKEEKRKREESTGGEGKEEGRIERKGRGRRRRISRIFFLYFIIKASKYKSMPIILLSQSENYCSKNVGKDK